MKKLLYPVIYTLGLVVVLVFGALTREPDPPPLVRTGAMTLPVDYQETFVHYMTVDRSDNTVRKLYIHPEALDLFQRDGVLPDGTQLIIEAFHAQVDDAGDPVQDENGRLIPGEMFSNIHMSEKRSTWTRADLATAGTDVDWNFAAFKADGSVAPEDNRNDCFTCHDAFAFRRDFTVSRQVIQQFLSSGRDVRYQFCPRAGRASCL